MNVRLALIIEGEDGLLRATEMIKFGEQIGDEVLMDGNYLDSIGECHVFDQLANKWVDAEVYSRLDNNDYYAVVGIDGTLLRR